ncbi:hypothetical protein DE146DRAFT_653712 [Phaeosphaeria sp. MPI-PUGE-AT-0046c]|nr:hypothetical protein DE146DRAFT_653712 [Phaeosphaeria sp. MPI-PUGE-AT-0046c]
MADRRGVRSASRRKTPTPQPSSKPTAPNPGRASRTRGLRSASRDIEPVVEAPKATRRSARQASVTTGTDDSENEFQTTRRTKRRPAKEVVADLTIVEEVDTQVDPEDAPGTPMRTSLDNATLFRSPGAASEMSGTTAITSFSMVEAEFLEPKYILKHLRKLCDSAQEFLEHLAPANGNMSDDHRNIQEILKPDSDFTEEYRDFNDELNVHLKHYKSEEHSYIHLRAVHRALFDADREAAAVGSGLDLILYLANVLIFAKQMIHSDRNEKEIWDALRQLDNAFPSHFMHSLESDIKPTTAGESAMLTQTLDLALELRTQLAILVLERASSNNNFDPDEVIQEVFYRSELSQGTSASIVRGWSIATLGGEDAALPTQFEASIVERLNIMRQFFPLDDEALERGDVIDLEGLGSNFPWEATILRLLEWVRCRHRELSTTIDELGGATAILRNVKAHVENPQIVFEQPQAVPSQALSPRTKRTSFGRDKRRSSRKFDPNAPLDLLAIDALKARELLSKPSVSQQVQEETLSQPSNEVEGQLPVVETQIDDHQPIVGDDDIERPNEQLDVEVRERSRSHEASEELETESRLPPTSSLGILKAVRAYDKREKENRHVSIFDPQINAEQVEFGDGFDTQPSPGRPSGGKGKQRSLQSSSRKRARPIEVESESDGEAFEAADRAERAHERRLKAPVTKKVRIDPSSSAAPTSHQPPARQEVGEEDAPRPEQNGSMSETDAPEMTEEAPPSTYQAQRRLAKQNIAVPALARRTERKPRTDWTPQEEDAFAEYMGRFPAKYSAILRYDQDEGYSVLQERTQVNLKDKARNMAINMIKSGTGLMTGFEDVVRPTSTHGKVLYAQGFRW